MFKTGDIVTNLHWAFAYFHICEGDKLISIGHEKYMFPDKPTNPAFMMDIKLIRDITMYSVAKQIEIDAVLKGRSFPQWVYDIQGNRAFAKAPQTIAEFKATPAGPAHTILTLGQLQGTCHHDWQLYRGFRFDDEFCTKCKVTRPVK